MKSTHKLLILVLTLVCANLFTTLPALSQAKGNVLKINILSPIAKTFNAQYERKVSANGSFQLGFYYGAFKIGDTKFSGIGITPEYRFYLSETESPQGVYIAPFVRYQSLGATRGTDKGTITIAGGGLIIGKQWVFKEKVVLDVFLGPKYSTASAKVTNGTNTFETGNGLSGFGLRAGVCFGLNF